MVWSFQICGCNGADGVELLRKLDFSDVFDYPDFTTNRLWEMLIKFRLLFASRVWAGRDCACITAFLLNFRSLADAVTNKGTVSSGSCNLGMRRLVLTSLRLNAWVNVF